MILDCHSHRNDLYPQGIEVLTPADRLSPLEGQLYTVGFHPWDITPETDIEAVMSSIEAMAALSGVVGIGETGLDKVKGTPMWLQINFFKAHVFLAERLGLPMVIHDVKCHQEIVQLRREYGATRPWVIHGFRGGASVARMLTEGGCCLSFGERFTPAALSSIPPETILAETDESILPIEEIITRLGVARELIAENTARVFKLN